MAAVWEGQGKLSSSRHLSLKNQLELVSYKGWEGFSGGPVVKNLCWEDPLEKEMATHSSTLAWKIPWTEERRRLQSMGLQRVRHD